MSSEIAAIMYSPILVEIMGFSITVTEVSVLGMKPPVPSPAIVRKGTQ